MLYLMDELVVFIPKNLNFGFERLPFPKLIRSLFNYKSTAESLRRRAWYVETVPKSAKSLAQQCRRLSSAPRMTSPHRKPLVRVVCCSLRASFYFHSPTSVTSAKPLTDAWLRGRHFCHSTGKYSFSICSTIHRH